MQRLSMPLWARLVVLTAAGLLSLIGSSMFYSSALYQTADRTTKMKELYDVAGTAGNAHIAFGELRYWLTDLSVSLLMSSERSANTAREKLDKDLERLSAHDPDTIKMLRAEVESYVTTAMDAANAYTDGNRVIGNTFLATARIHSAKVDQALNDLVEKVNAAAVAERQLVIDRADSSARMALYIVIALCLIGMALTVLVLRSIVGPLQRLNDGIAGLMQGRYDVEIPPEGNHEFGAMARTLNLFRDSIVERQRLETEAEAQRQTIATAIETIPDGFVLYDSDACIVLANSKYTEMFPQIASHVQPGVSFRQIMEAQVKSGEARLGDLSPEAWIEQRVARHLEDHDSVDERRYGDAWVRISKRQTPDGGKVAVYTDITELKQRETEISNARDAAEAALSDLQKAQARLVQSEKMASLGQLTAGIAHEIKNPLNFVNNFSKLSDELLRELEEVLQEPIKALDDEVRDEAEDLLKTVRENLIKISDHGKRADSIVKNMLLHSRDGPSERRSANINAIAEEALNLAYHGLRAENSNFNIEIVKSLAADTGDIECYPQDLLRVFLNLINNGMYAAHKRGEDQTGDFSPKLWLTTQVDGDMIKIEVRDNGNGIPSEIQEKIFTPFFTTKPAGQGTGLGLSLSYDIVNKQHGGELTVNSRPGEFTAFQVALARTLADVDDGEGKT
ncbi:MAG: HAMP domain-containing protein [Anderseniella sp.]|nr:HAMP domain-containing protein [Anderseniella sp.]